MSRIHTFSTYLVDYGERLSKMADAAEGKHRQTGRMRRLVLLPAAGAGLYALVRSDFFSRQAKEVVGEARSRAADLPDELMHRVHQATNGAKRGGAGAASTTSSRQSSRSPRTRSKRRTSSSSR
jgi:hypothetical protein